MRLKSSDFHKEFFDKANRPRAQLLYGPLVYLRFVEINPDVITLEISYVDKKKLGIRVAQEISIRSNSSTIFQLNENSMGYFDLLLPESHLDLTIDYVVLEEENYFYLNIISIV